MRRAHLAAVLHHLAVRLGGLEVQPPVRVQQLDLGQLDSRERHGLAQFECAGAVMRERRRRDRDGCATRQDRSKHMSSSSAYFADANPSAHENSRNSSFGADTLRYVRTEVKGSSSAFGSMTVIRSSSMPGDVNLMRSRTVN